MDYERLYVESLGTIDQVARALARRHRLSPDDAEELRSAARFKVFENDYAVLRRFEHRSNLRTYLLIVIERDFLDARMAQWGKWRPCREAKRLGAVAVLLDRLLTRDRLPFDQACEVLRTNHRVVESREELYALSLRLPNRATRMMVGEGHLDALTTNAPAPEAEVDRAAFDSVSVEDSLQAALAGLTPQDRLILKMHFSDNMSVAEISRALSLEQKRLYRRLDSVKAVLRREMESRGIAKSTVLAVLGHPSFELAPVILSSQRGEPGVGPSSSRTDALSTPETGGRHDG